MKEEIKEVMAKTFNIEKNSIPEKASIQNVEEWDSLNHINFVISLEENFGVKFKTEIIPDLTSLTIIKEKLEEKLE